MLVAVGLDAARLRELLTAGLVAVAAHAPTDSLLAALGLDVTMMEDAEFGALTYASVACLVAAPYRLVAVAEVADPSGLDAADSFGSVTLPRLAWAQVRSLFADEPQAAPLVAAAREAAMAASTLEGAWDTGAVQTLLEEADLLWYAPEEHGDVLAMLEG